MNFIGFPELYCFFFTSIFFFRSKNRFILIASSNITFSTHLAMVQHIHMQSNEIINCETNKHSGHQCVEKASSENIRIISSDEILITSRLSNTYITLIKSCCMNLIVVIVAFVIPANIFSISVTQVALQLMYVNRLE